ncbi:hypothetical protein Ac2012v2_001144 [Leucoagaricus gongylophorus]
MASPAMSVRCPPGRNLEPKLERLSRPESTKQIYPLPFFFTHSLNRLLFRPRPNFLPPYPNLTSYIPIYIYIMSEQPLADPAPPKIVEVPEEEEEEEEEEDHVNLDEEHGEDAEGALGGDNEDDDDYEEEEEEDEGDDDDEVHIEGEGHTNGNKQNLTALLLGDPKADDDDDDDDEEEEEDDEYLEDNGAVSTKKRPIDEVTGDNDTEKDPKKVKA